MSNTKKYVLLFCILIIATFFRFYHLTTIPPGLYPDEAMNGNNASEVIQTGQFKVFYPENNGREGLFIGIQALVLKTIGLHEAWVLRLPSAVVGTITVLGIYFLAAELFGTEIGLLAAFFIATSFWHINFSRIGFRAIMAPFLLVWGVYFFMRALRAISSMRGMIYATLAGIIYALGFYTYISYRVTPLLFLLFLPFFQKHPEFWKRTIIFISVTFLVCLPIGLYFLGHPGDFFGRTSQISVSSSQSPLQDLALNIAKTALMFNVSGDYNWRQNISGAPELFWPVGILFLLGIVIGVRQLWKQFRAKEIVSGENNMFPNFSLLFIFVMFLLAGLPAVISNEGIPHALRSIIMIPPVMMLAAIGTLWLYRWLMAMPRYQNFTKILSLILLAYIAIIGGYASYFITWAQNPNVPEAFAANYVDIGNQINALPTNIPKYVVVNAGGVMARGLPIPTETVIFITDSFLPDQATAKNIHYLLPNEISAIPAGTSSSTIFYIN